MFLTIAKEDGSIKYATKHPPIAKGDKLVFPEFDVLDLNEKNTEIVEVPDEELPIGLLTDTVFSFDAKTEGAERFVKVADIEKPPEPEQFIDLWLHIQLSGGDGIDPVGIETNTSPDIIGVATIRGSGNPASPVVQAFSGKWRVTLRQSDGRIYDVIAITFDKGVANFLYRRTRASKRGPGVVHLLPSDLEPVRYGNAVYTLQLAGAEPVFKVYEDA